MPARAPLKAASFAASTAAYMSRCLCGRLADHDRPRQVRAVPVHASPEVELQEVAVADLARGHRGVRACRVLTAGDDRRECDVLRAVRAHPPLELDRDVDLAHAGLDEAEYVVERGVGDRRRAHDGLDLHRLLHLAQLLDPLVDHGHASGELLGDELEPPVWDRGLQGQTRYPLALQLLAKLDVHRLTLESDRPGRSFRRRPRGLRIPEVRVEPRHIPGHDAHRGDTVVEDAIEPGDVAHVHRKGHEDRLDLLARQSAPQRRESGIHVHFSRPFT
jgi:hypothetical protein